MPGVLLVPSVRGLRRLEGAADIHRPLAAPTGEPTEPPLRQAGGSPRPG